VLYSKPRDISANGAYLLGHFHHAAKLQPKKGTKTMGIELWTPNDLFMLRNDPRMDALPSWILDTYFGETFFSEDDEIRFGDLPEADRYLAPFVLPYEQGKPLDIRRGESVSAFAPAYIKLKNAVRPEDARNLKPSEIFRNGGQRPSLAQRFDMRVTEIVEHHLRSIRVREIWMAARAFIDAKVQIDYERDQGVANPSVLLDFGGAAKRSDQTKDQAKGGLHRELEFNRS
jgi:hypothetical protein